MADLVNAYTENDHMGHSSLEVEFKDEDGVDEGGLTKECLRLFWEQFMQKHCTGRLQKAPKLDYRNPLKKRLRLTIKIISQSLFINSESGGGGGGDVS